MSAARSTVLVLLGLMALAAVLLTPPPAVLAQSPSTDATLGGLTLSEGRLDPVFATGTTDYAAGVGYTVTRITVVPTTTDANATVAYLDGSDTPLPDANTVTDEQDVDLVVGETVVKVKITAEDTSTLLTYTVTITRTEEDTSLRPTASDPVAANPSTAVYGVTFQGTWTSSVTPDGVPGGAHFSRLIGGVHSAAVTFLEGGQTASTGVESMAEVGGVSDLKSEVQTAIDASPQTALSVLEGDTGSIGPATAKTLGSVEFTTDFPRVTLTTMVAPSPDWFVGVSGLPLLDDQGRWLRTHEVNLYPWDAGTEDGTEFSLSNAATNPRGVITSIRGTGKFSTERIASLSFTLVSVGATRSVAENTAAGVGIGAPVTTTTVGGVVTYTLGGTDAASFDIVEATGQLQAKAALDYETRSSYEVTVTATNSEGSVDITVTIDVTNVIELQPLTGPATVGYEENQAVRVATFSASSEADRELLSWSLSGANAGGYDSTRTLSTGLEPGTGYDVRIRSLNGGKPSANSTKVTARAGADNNPATGLPTLSGDTAPGSELSASVEEIGDADGLSGAQFTYQWLRVSVDSETEISGANSAIYVVSLDDLGFMLKVQVNFTDDLGNPETLTSMVSVTVTFPAGECDAIDLGDRRSVWSGVMSPIALATTPLATGYNAKIGGTLSDTQLVFDNETRTIERFEVLNVSADLILAFDQALTDRGNETLRLHLCGEALAISDATTNIDGVISWGRAGPDWSSATKVQAELTIPGNYPPRFASDSVERDLAENSPDGAAVGDPVTADDWDDDTLSYTLSGTYAAAFGIDAATGQITTAPNTKFNFENTTALDVTVTATDPGGDSDTVDVIITITDVPEPATGLPTVEGIAQENRALYADAYTIEDPDGIPPNSFSYQWVRVEGNTDILIPGETSAKYVVAAADVGFTLKVIISFTDSGGTVERLTSAESDTVVAAMPSECPAPDLGGRIEVWSATLTPANIDTALGTIGYDAQHGTLSDTSFDVAGDETVIEQIYVNEYTDRLILAFDSDQALPEQGHRTLRLHLCGKSVPLAGGGLAIHHILRWSSLRLDWTAGTTVHLALSAPAANVELPEFSSATTTRSVAENTAAVMDIGAPVTATIVGAAVTYTLGGTDAASFDIVEATGQLQTKAALDYETRSSYEVTVTATNSEGSVDIIVTIDVTNIVELQPLTGPATVGYEENRAVRVAAYSASSEEDRELLTWSLSGPDAGSFRIDEPAGVLRFDLPIVAPNLFAPQPDYEAPTDTGTDGAYEVTVEVGDGVTTHSLDVEVTITDQDEAGTLTLSPTRPRQAELVTATLSDPDTVTGTPVWTWERSAGRSAWHVINGATAASYTPTAADAGHYLRVTASYTDGHGSGQTAQTVAPNVVLARTLSRIEVVTTSSRQMYPAFEPEILHYAVGCVAADTLRLTLSTTDADTRLAVDGVQYANQNAVVELTGKDGEGDILITLSDASDGASTTYTIHCLADAFATLTVTKQEGASESLMTVSYGQYLAIIDHKGVPRFRGQGRGHFRAYPDGAYPYAVHVRADSAYTVYDGTFNVVQSGITTVNLHDTNSHDFFIKPNGDYVLIAYEPAVRDLSFISEQFGLTNEDGEPYGTAEDVEDSVIQVVTPAGQEVFLWSSWDHMAIEDCTQHRFPGDYAHVNSVQAVDGDIIASFRGCSRVLRIDGTSGDVIWRLGRSNLSTEEWESRNIGPPPLKIIGDPYGEFCGQHAARLLDNGNLILFDNGVQCLEDPRTGGTERVGGQFSRVVEYAIDLEYGEAIFQRHAFLHGSMNRLSYAMGQADALDNGNWLITWGRGLRAPNPGDPPAPDVSATQVNPATGVEELTVVARVGGNVQTEGRMYPVAPVALAAEPIALAAEFPASTYTSIFHIGATDEPQVVVSFSRPIVDFDETSPSISVSGAEVASVSAHVVAGEPAHAYLVTLTPDDYGPITFRLLTYQACAGGGICTADGTQLTEAPAAPLIIPTFVAEVSIEPGPSPVTEGADVTFTLTRDGPLTAELTVNVSVAETGSMLSGALPASATFEVGADTTSLTLTTEDDAPIEDPSTVTVTIEAGARYQAAPGAATADVVVLDDLPRFLLRVGPAEVTEGGGGAVTVEIDNGVSLTTAETISLTLSGTATADDFTLLSTSDRTLSAPYALTIPANEGVAAAYISTVNDALAEPAETLTITASHDGTDIGTGTMTLRASPLRLELSSLAASGGGGRAMYPSFDAGTLHYAVGCDPARTLTLRLTTKDATTRLAVNGVQQVSQNAVVELNELDGDDDILITLSNAAGASTTYVVHCMNSDDPYLEAEKQPGSAIELIASSVNEGPGLGARGHLLVIDANGVPRVHRRIDNPRVTHFRPQDNREFPYSHALILPEPFQSPWGARRDFEISILDRDFNEVRRVTTTDAIQHTDQHDFLVKPNGNFVLMAYESIERDLSEFVDRHGNPYGTMEFAEDSLIEEVTPEGDQVFFWSTYDHMYLGDCMVNQFPANYAHLNSLQLVDDDLVISLRNCSQVLRIDGTTGEVQWRLGSSKRSDAEWEALGLQPPLQIIGDPYVEFCAQHSAKLMPNGHLLLYDNGWHCPRDPATGLPRRPEEEFSRVVEYALDLERGTATFVRHHSLHGTFTLFNTYQGLVVPMDNDSWLISWGFSFPNFTNRPDTTATEYNPTTDQELLSLTIRHASRNSVLESRAYPLGFDVLEQQAKPLTAALPESAHTSVFTFGQSDTPTVVVAFSEPVKDFAADTPSVSVGGATIASVAAHVMPGEPANAYLFTLTPDGDGPITLGLVANQSCSSGGICTEDGARLSVVPEAYTIEAPVRVSFEQTSFTASEGASASIVVILSAPSGPFGITIPIVVTGGTASADEYRAPESVVFSSGSDRQTVSIPLGDDALIEGDETIALAFGDLPTGVTPGTNSTTTVTITDADSAAFEFAISDDEVGEGAAVELTVTLIGGATFATAQTINLTFPGGAATAGVDFTVADSRGQALTAPYALTLPAGSSSVVATISIVDDAEQEDDETILVRARHGAASLGDKFITILANDAPPPPTNSPPVFTEGRSAARSLAENTGPSINIGRPLAATDVDQGDTLTYSLGGTDAGSFDISLTSGQLRTKSRIVYDHEARAHYEVTVSVSDGEATASITVSIAVTDVDEPPDAPVVQVDTASPVSLNVTWLAPATPGRPAVRDYDLRYKLVSETGFIDGPQDVSGTSASIGELIPASSYDVQVRATNAEGDGPWSASQPGETAVLPAVTLILSPPTIPENRGMSTVTATVSPASPAPFTLTVWAVAFPPVPGQFETSANSVLSFAANAAESTGEVVITGLVAVVVNVTGTVSPAGVLVKPPARVQLRITAVDTDPDPQPGPIIAGGGGGGPSGPTPSGIEFEWNVTRDIEQLDSGHEAPTGAWSDGTLLWLAENGDGADDAVYAYDLKTGERVEEREFELDESNRAPRGLWSNGKTAWVADSGQDRLFAYDLESGERDEEREVELDTRNRDPRGIWSDGTTVWVLDGGKNALFAYDLASGELIAEYTLDPANGDPRGIWSDGVTVWVSDHGAKRLFAYRLAAQDAETTTGEDEEAAPLERARDEEFTELSRASNNSPRGIWSDGEVMYVADESDGRVYSYNLPDAIDARLASLTLSGVQFGEFLSRRTEYEGVSGDGVTETTVAAEAAQSGAEVVIDPPDADEAADGHQLALAGLDEITVTVTSPDGSRTKGYRVRIGGASGEPSAAACLRGAITVGFSLLVSEGGSIEDLAACAQSRHVTAIYALHEGEYVSYILGAPEFVNSAFRELFAGGVPSLTPLTARSEGPATADPAAGSEVTEPWPLCLRGAITEGFSLVLYEGGSVDALDACAQSREVSAVYALHEGEWVSYILGAPDFVTAAFRELFADGLPAVMPLVAKSEGPPRAN